MTIRPRSFKAVPPALIDKATHIGGEEFAESLRVLISVVRWESHLRPDDTWTPATVRAKTRPILSAGSRLLNAVDDASEWLRLFANEERSNAGGEYTDGPLPDFVEDARRNVAELLKLTRRLNQSLARKRPPDRDRIMFLHMLRGHFERFGVPWASTCPIDPLATNQVASLAVESVAAALGLTLQAASKSIQRMDK
jgi:hypothetical protein